MSMIPQHHPSEDILLAYATGNGEEALNVVIATHLTLCPQCRERVQMLEDVGGAMLMQTEPQSVSDDALSKMLERLNEPEPQSETLHAPSVKPPQQPANPILPRTLTHYCGPFESLAWKRTVPGMWQVQLPIACQGIPLRLLKFNPGFRIRDHTHRALEIDLVLSGTVRDESNGNRYTRGDLFASDASVEHALQIEANEECVALELQSEKLVVKSFFWRMLFRYAGW